MERYLASPEQAEAIAVSVLQQPTRRQRPDVLWAARLIVLIMAVAGGLLGAHLADRSGGLVPVGGFVGSVFGVLAVLLVRILARLRA